MGKKAIIFDLDETLRKVEFDSDYKKILNVTLRPNIKNLLEKLKEVKEEGTDIIVWSNGYLQSVKNHFIEHLPEEYRDLFNTIVCRENKVQIERDSVEEKIYSMNAVYKPITALKEYNQLLFFDDNKLESANLNNVFENESKAPDKQVVFASYEYSAPKPNQMYAYKKIAEEDTKTARKVNSLFTKYLEDPGCELMIEKIDEFQNLEFAKGLTTDINNSEMNDFRFEIADLQEELDAYIYENKDLWSKYHKHMEEYYKLIKQKQKELNEDER